MKRADKSQAFARPSRAGSLELVGGALALDLTNTSSGRGTPGHQEHLRDFDTVMQWVAHARILTPGDCAYIRAAAASRPKLARALFERLLEIRELIWMIATALAEQRPVGEKLRALLTAADAESLRHAETRMREGEFIWVWGRSPEVKAAVR